jgi:hypothetical protein
MDVRTEGSSIELDMNNRIMKSSKDDISITFYVTRASAPAILEYLKGKYVCSTEEFEDDVLFLYVNWHRRSEEQSKEGFIKKLFRI